MKQRAELDAKSRGYHLTSDTDFLRLLLEGLIENVERYGYPSCPCRMSSGVFEIDRDIICPCDYRDPDVEEYGTCYCCLYVDSATHKSGETKPIPERRPMKKQIRSLEASTEVESDNEVDLLSVSALKLYYCKQCGYVVFREEPPYVCPICRAKKEFFADMEQPKMQI